MKKNWLERLTERIHKSDAQKMEEYVSPQEQIAYISKCLAKSFDSIADAEDLTADQKSAALVESTAQAMDFMEKAAETWFDTDEMPEDEELEKAEDEMKEPAEGNEEEPETDETMPQAQPEAESEPLAQAKAEMEKAAQPYVAPVTEEARTDPAIEPEKAPVEEEVAEAQKSTTDIHLETPAIAAEDTEVEDFMKYSDFDIAAMEENDRKNLEELTKKYCRKCFDTKPVVEKGCEDGECAPEEDVTDNPIIAKALSDLETMRAEHAALCKELEMRDMREIAKSYECTGQNVGELTRTLYNLRKSGRKAFDDHIQLLEQMKKNYTEGVFKTFGSDKAEVIDHTNAFDQAVADIQKSHPELSRSEAIVRAYQENPALPEYE